METLAERGLAEAAALDVTSIHESHAGFVWASLQRCGVRDADLEDMVQEVFVVVHRKLSTFDGSSRLTTWLFGICMRVASAYRRRAHIRRERSVDLVPEPSHDATHDPENAASLKEQRALLGALLDELEVDKRAVFVMFEVDELSCQEIAAIVGIPLGTVYSRLSAARNAFELALRRLRARQTRGGRP